MIAGIPITRILQISWTFDLLMLLSILALGVVIERWNNYRKMKTDPQRFMERIKMSIGQGKIQEALFYCEQAGNSLANVIKVGLQNYKLSKDAVFELLEGARMLERVHLEKWLTVLGTLGNSAPFIGLLGTVIGIIRAFGDLARSGSSDPKAVMLGISEALVATAAGLFVAIPCAVMYNYFMNQVKRFAVEMEVASKELVVFLSERERLSEKKEASGF